MLSVEWGILSIVSIVSPRIPGFVSEHVRNLSVDKIHLLKRMTLELRDIQTLYSKLAVAHSLPCSEARHGRSRVDEHDI